MDRSGQELRYFHQQPIFQNVIYRSNWKVESAWSSQWVRPDIRKRHAELTDQVDGNMSVAHHGTLSRHGQRAPEPEISNDLSVVVQIQSTLECACCFDNIPTGEVASCTNIEPHYFCFSCARKYAEIEIGKANFGLKCIDGSGCSAPFAEGTIKEFLGSKAFESLDKLRTADAIKQAGLEGLVHCPFCSFAAVMDDPNDLIFRCVSCGVHSCRNCRVKSHHPMSCEKYQSSLSAKHFVEEAMTAALVRKCNKCAKPFLKEDGCNKMKCSCGNIQCYVCSVNIFDYSHFGDGKPCPMYGDMADLLQKQVDTAEEVTVQKLLEDRSDLKDEDIRVRKRQKLSTGDTSGFRPSYENPWRLSPQSTNAPTNCGFAFPVQHIPPPRFKHGNNPYGSSGCASCSNCRRRKGRALLPECNFANRKCVFGSKDARCEFCVKMGHECGPKLTKAEFITLHNTRAASAQKYSSIARELEQAFPDLEPAEIHKGVSRRLEKMLLRVEVPGRCFVGPAN